jgi:hypothetical protein
MTPERIEYFKKSSNARGVIIVVFRVRKTAEYKEIKPVLDS